MNYRKTILACGLGFITQAIAANFAPLLFLKFHADYGIPLGKIALIPTIFFMTQLVVDGLCARYADRIGHRRCVVGSQIFSALGLMGLGILPELLADPFWGIGAATALYAIGSGLTEVLCSPIVEACPFEHKEAVMSLLHSFYCWGSVGVVLLSTVFFAAFGMGRWKALAFLWALVPLYNIYNFCVCPIVPPAVGQDGGKAAALARAPLFWLSLLLMLCAGAAELSMSQWASAFAEAALGVSKAVGDLAGPCMFAAAMGVSRALYGKYGIRLKLRRCMLLSGILCVFCYGLAAFSTAPLLGLLGCIVCGFSVGILWPGTISLCAGKIPGGGTAMFALLAMAGDLGGALGPGLVGQIAQWAGNDIQKGLFAGSLFPLVLVAALLVLRQSKAAESCRPGR